MKGGRAGARVRGTRFLLGLVVVADDTTDLTLRGLELELEPVPFEVSAEAIDGLPAVNKSLLSSYLRGARGLGAAIGVGLVGGGMGISIKDAPSISPPKAGGTCSRRRSSPPGR